MARVVVVGEAWGEQEDIHGLPFVGPAGRFLHYMLNIVGIPKKECFFTNVFNFRPRPSNDIKHLTGPKKQGIPGMGPLMKGKYIRAEYTGEIKRLHEEIKNEDPNLIIALGGTAVWALTGQGGIKNVRGSVFETPHGKVLATYHPFAVLRQYKLKPIMYMDLCKAQEQSHSKIFQRPERLIHIAETVDDILNYYYNRIRHAPTLSIDIETWKKQITCIGFSPATDEALVIPICTKEKKDGNYWPDLQTELRVWELIKQICESHKNVVGQNFMYDMRYLWEIYGIRVFGAMEDTMLLQHAQEPEMEKGLGFLASIYTLEPPWKTMRKRAKEENVKKED